MNPASHSVTNLTEHDFNVSSGYQSLSSKTLSIDKDMEVAYKGKAFKVIVPHEQWVIIQRISHLESYAPETLSIKEIKNLVKNGEFSIMAKPGKMVSRSVLSHKALKKLEILEQYVEELQKWPKKGSIETRKKVIALVSKRIGDTSPLSISALHRWNAIYEADGTLLNHFLSSRENKRRSSISREVNEFMDEFIKKNMDTPSRPGIRLSYKKMVSKLAQSGFPGNPPSES